MGQDDFGYTYKDTGVENDKTIKINDGHIQKYKLPKPFVVLSRLIFLPLGLILGALLGEMLVISVAFLSEVFIREIVLIACTIVVGIISLFIGPVLCQLVYTGARKLIFVLRNYTGQEVVAGALGLTAGMFLASILDDMFNVIGTTWLKITLSAVCYAFFAFIGLIIGVSYFKGVIVTTDVTDKNVPKLLDSSVLIDGRISGVAKTGFVEGPFVIPSFVVSQLQGIADSEDILKRSRGRRGLDVIAALEELQGVKVIIDDTDFNDITEIDAKVLKLARKLKGVIITVDFNLGKVAAVNKIKVLNLNELSNAIKPVVIPGEKITLTILKEGKENGQGVSYLEDGTMVVVENGGVYVGKTAVVTITTSLQTNAGRIIFGRILEE